MFPHGQTFPFTSESKRMGILVRDERTGEITFYMKGADTVMSRIVQYNDWLEEECGNMAREGQSLQKPPVFLAVSAFSIYSDPFLRSWRSTALLYSIFR